MILLECNYQIHSQMMDDDNNPIIKEKNNDLKDERNPLIVSPSQSEKVRIIIKSPTLKDKESMIIQSRRGI